MAKVEIPLPANGSFVLRTVSSGKGISTTIFIENGKVKCYSTTYVERELRAE